MILFQQHPQIQYSGRKAVNLVTRASIYDSVLAKFEVFYDYKVLEGERPDTIAADYYKDSTFDWLILLTNRITNYYSQWPKNHTAFIAYMKDKYGAVNPTMQEIHHYDYTLEEESVRRYTHQISPETYGEMTVDDRYGWTPVYTYDWEYDLNESKRNIRLLSNQYIGQVQSELVAIFQ